MELGAARAPSSPPFGVRAEFGSCKAPDTLSVGDKGQADAGKLLVWVYVCLTSGLPQNTGTQRFCHRSQLRRL